MLKKASYSFSDLGPILVLLLSALGVTVVTVIGWQLQALGGMIVLFLAGVALGVLWRRPVLGLALLLVGVPFHSLALLLLVGVLDVPAPLAWAFTAWKEALLVLLLGRILVRWLHLGQSRIRVSLVDMFGVSYLLLILFYALLPNEAVGWGGRLRAARTDSIFLLAFWIGRGLYPGLVWFRRLVYLSLELAAVAGLVAWVEHFLLPGDLLLRLGLEQYFAFLGVSGVNRLPVQFFSGGGLGAQRAGSFYINPIELGIGMVVGLSLSISLVMAGLWRSRRVVMPTLGLMVVGVVLSIVRSALLGLAVSLAIITLGCHLTRRLVTVLTLAGGILIALGARLGLGRLAIQTLTLSDPSSHWRLVAWREGVEAILEQPWGRGLGTVGALAERFADASVRITSENWYLQLGVELGVLGLILYLGILVLMAYGLFWHYRHAHDPFRKALAFGIFAALIGLSFVGQFLHVWSYLSLSIPFWLLVGLCWTSCMEEHAHRY